MRENRTYGSEGGEAGEPAFPTPIVARKKQFAKKGSRGILPRMFDIRSVKGANVRRV
jgi:hypothetical protein